MISWSVKYLIFLKLQGSASFLLPALVVGAVGGICALANVLPKQVYGIPIYRLKKRIIL